MVSAQVINSLEVCGTRVKSLDEARVVIVDAYEQKFGKPLASMLPAEYSQLICELDAMGFFALRGAATYLSKRLGVSRVTIYNSLKKSNL